MLDEQTVLRHKAINHIQSIALVGLLALLLGHLAHQVGEIFLAFLMVLAWIITFILYPLYSPTLVLRMYRCRPIEFGQAPELYAIVKSLAERAGLAQTPKLYRIPDDSPNALAIGHHPSAIAVSDGLLEIMSRREAAAILAHEITHIRHSDTMVMSFADLTTYFTRVLSLIGILLLLANIPLLLAGYTHASWFAVSLLIASPGLSSLTQLALSRTREYHADLGAILLFGDPAALASALVKMEKGETKRLKKLLKRHRPSNFLLLRSHPPTELRIHRLRLLQDKVNLDDLLQNFPFLQSDKPLTITPTD